MSFQQISLELFNTVQEVAPALRNLSDSEVSSRPAPTKWSKKEIFGHLLDSASNNHQRFVRATTQGSLTFPGYAQDSLVELQQFRSYDWPQLITFWESYNCFLSHVIANLPESAANISCSIGNAAPVTLGFIAQDYVDHLKHHLNQILGTKYETAYGAEK